MTPTIDQLISTIIKIVPPVIGGLLGFGGSRLGRFLLQKRSKRNKIRTALLSEIKAPKEAINNLAEQSYSEDMIINYSTIPREFYESHSEEIGLLSKEEVEYVVKYYSNAKLAESQLSSMYNDEEDADLEKFLDEVAPRLKQSRDDAERKIEKHTGVANNLPDKIPISL